MSNIKDRFGSIDPEHPVLDVTVDMIGIHTIRRIFAFFGQSVEYYGEEDLRVVTDREKDWVTYILFSPIVQGTQLFTPFIDSWSGLKIPSDNVRGMQIMNSASAMYKLALREMSNGECTEEIAFNVFHGHDDEKPDPVVVVENAFGRLADLAIRYGSTDEVISCGGKGELYMPHVQAMLNEYKKEYLLSNPGKRTEWIVDLYSNIQEMSRILKS